MNMQSRFSLLRLQLALPERRTWLTPAHSIASEISMNFL